MAAALAVAALVSAITAPVSALVAAVSGLIASEAPGGIGGQAAARVAMAEYQAGVADGTMHRNDPKYWEAVAGSGFSDASSTPWGACFVSRCLAEAGFADGDGAIAPTTTYTGDFIDYYAANPERGSVLGLKGPFAEMTADPQPGDIVCYGADEACSDHVGLVVETGTDAEGRRYFCTVEGNTGIGSADGTGVNMHRYTDANPSQMQSATAWWAGMDGWAYALVCRPAYPAPGGPIELPATDPATGKAIGTYGSIEYVPRDNWWDSDFAQARVQRAWNERGAAFDEEGFARIDGKYILACTSTFGEVGDEVVFYLDGGGEVDAVIGDEKAQVVCAWDDDPANRWGHDDGACVIELFMRPGSAGNVYAMLGLSGRRVVSAENLGRYL